MSEHFQNEDEHKIGQEESAGAPLAENGGGVDKEAPQPPLTEALNEENTREDHKDAPAETPQPYLYRWDAVSQSAQDRENEQKRHRRGILTYAIAMASIFAVCILLLLGVILFSGATSYAPPVDSGLSAIGAVSESVKPSVVLIEASSGVGMSYGTGFFMTSDGYIATNHHVVKNAQSIKVTLFSGKTYEATLKGAYAPDDLALIKIEGRGFPVLECGNSNALRVGDTVVAVGNPSGAEGAWTTTHGIVSALDRKVAVSADDFSGVMKMIQTDAPVNPGNSGGPLCNLNGEVIGIVTQKLSDYEAIGFAIPINEAKRTLDAIMSGRIDSFDSTVTTKRPTIGVTVKNISKGEQYRVGTTDLISPVNGVLISDVSAGSAADGVILAGDILFEFGGNAVGNTSALQSVLYRYHAGDTVTLRVYRGTDIKTLKITLK